jgi:hypothetical protein
LKYVTLQMKPYAPEPRASPEQLSAFTRSHSVRQCATVAHIVMGELARRGARSIHVGDPYFCAMEAKVVLDLINHEADLDEIAAQIEEAKWEQGG